MKKCSNASILFLILCALKYLECAEIPVDKLGQVAEQSESGEWVYESYSVSVDPEEEQFKIEKEADNKRSIEAEIARIREAKIAKIREAEKAAEIARIRAAEEEEEKRLEARMAEIKAKKAELETMQAEIETKKQAAIVEEEVKKSEEQQETQQKQPVRKSIKLCTPNAQSPNRVSIRKIQVVDKAESSDDEEEQIEILLLEEEKPVVPEIPEQVEVKPVVNQQRPQLQDRMSEARKSQLRQTQARQALISLARQSRTSEARLLQANQQQPQVGAKSNLKEVKIELKQQEAKQQEVKREVKPIPQKLELKAVIQKQQTLGNSLSKPVKQDDNEKFYDSQSSDSETSNSETETETETETDSDSDSGKSLSLMREEEEPKVVEKSVMPVNDMRQPVKSLNLARLSTRVPAACPIVSEATGPTTQHNPTNNPARRSILKQPGQVGNSQPNARKSVTLMGNDKPLKTLAEERKSTNINNYHDFNEDGNYADDEDYFASRKSQGPVHSPMRVQPKGLYNQQQKQSNFYENGSRIIGMNSRQSHIQKYPSEDSARSTARSTGPTTTSDISGIKLGFCEAAALGTIANIRMVALKYPRQANSLERKKTAQYISGLIDNFPCEKEKELMKKLATELPPIYTERRMFGKWAAQFTKKFLSDSKCPVGVSVSGLLIPLKKK